MESTTKIIATIGPASRTKESILELIKHKVNIFRLNFSWDTHEGHKEIIDNIEKRFDEKLKNTDLELASKYLMQSPLLQARMPL